MEDEMDWTEMEELVAGDQLREFKRFALENWLQIYRQIVNNGGILPPTEDYRDVPVCVRRRVGFPIDTIASQFGYDYIDEFVTYIAGAHKMWKLSTTATEAPATWAA